MKRYFALVVTTTLFANTALSQAAVITASASKNATTNWGTSALTPNYQPTFALTVGGFDPSLGTLTGVGVTLTSTVAGSITLTNNGDTATEVSGYLNDIQRDIFPDGSKAVLQTSTDPFTVSALAGHTSVGPQIVTAASDPSVSNFTTGLSQFDTSWTLLAGDFGSVSVSSANGNGSAIYTDQSLVQVAVQYTYTPSLAPEPTTLAILGSGLACLGLLGLGSRNPQATPAGRPERGQLRRSGRAG